MPMMQGKGMLGGARPQQQQGLGPSMGIMGGMMGRKMGQQSQPPGNRFGNQMGALGSALGGFQQQRQVGQNRQMPFQPRQDMQDMTGQIGMTQPPPPQMQQLPAIPGMDQMQDPMMQRKLQMQQQAGGMGPSMGMMARRFGNQQQQALQQY